MGGEGGGGVRTAFKGSGYNRNGESYEKRKERWRFTKKKYSNEGGASIFIGPHFLSTKRGEGNTG